LKSILNNISTIIFDLGGVVLNLDIQRSISAFSKISGLTKKEVYKKFVDDDWARAFEKGEITPNAFRDLVRNSLNNKLSDAQINLAWDAMLLELPYSRIKMLSDLRPKYRTFVLSNTNEIHVQTFDKIVSAASGGKLIYDFFDKVYFSSEIGMRKPDTEIYSYVLEENKLDPSTTLFIDDMKENILAAKALGIKTVHLTDQEDLNVLFS
jgi:epoxide hydrolase-like predicted phosphatase